MKSFQKNPVKKASAFLALPGWEPVVKLEPQTLSRLDQSLLPFLPGLGLPAPALGMTDPVQSCLRQLQPGFSAGPDSWTVL